MMLLYLFFVAMLAVWLCIFQMMLDTINAMTLLGETKTKKGRRQVAAMVIACVLCFVVIVASFSVVFTKGT